MKNSFTALPATILFSTLASANMADESHSVFCHEARMVSESAYEGQIVSNGIEVKIQFESEVSNPRVVKRLPVKVKGRGYYFSEKAEVIQNGKSLSDLMGFISGDRFGLSFWKRAAYRDSKSGKNYVAATLVSGSPWGEVKETLMFCDESVVKIFSRTQVERLTTEAASQSGSFSNEGRASEFPHSRE